MAKKKRHTEQEKIDIVKDYLSMEKPSLRKIADKHDINKDTLSKWIKQYSPSLEKAKEELIEKTSEKIKDKVGQKVGQNIDKISTELANAITNFFDNQVKYISELDQIALGFTASEIEHYEHKQIGENTVVTSKKKYNKLQALKLIMSILKDTDKPEDDEDEDSLDIISKIEAKLTSSNKAGKS